jgi:hypothetical protein
MSSSLLCSRRNHKKDRDGEQVQVIMSTAAAVMRKGPWTDEEDEQLVRFVRLFGERRWDFLAKVSGLRGGGCVDRSLHPCLPSAILHACMRRIGRPSEISIEQCR